jgi:hypothetical protein
METPVEGIKEHSDLKYGENTVVKGGNDEISLPVEEALSKAAILEKASDNQLLEKLWQNRRYKEVSDDDDHFAFEASPQRIAYLALHFALNSRNLTAPFFRPIQRDWPYTPTDKQLKRIDVIYSLDLQLIDVHWWTCRASLYDINSFIIDKTEVLSQKQIQPEGLEKAAYLNWSAAKKVDALSIPEQEQVLMNKLRTKNIYDRQRNVIEAEGNDRTKILTKCYESSQRRTSDAEELYNDLCALKLAGGSPKHAVEIKQLMLGYEGNNFDQKAAIVKMRKQKRWFKEQLHAHL